ncbi:uncharacterized protein TRUGW13939_09596 [Talaromyces rugulosus]|uniref:Uncharacterized protein n=1 Tax=Talaromyces rugulosus TaxID=121627 RepID=A0A7H8RAD9_TALRU|nr:uncharacterized protein TRUGW13939_09596 [Talaromyces rugulosus]QKX62435.1 hypothetical protein TRUGW13939_09596 [Talaromyces rugulosus]
MSSPDLSAVLQTLSTFSQTQTQQRPPPATSASASTSTSTSTTVKQSSSSSLSHHSSSSSSSSQSKHSNPSQITTWPAALRHIMHHQTAHNHAAHHFTAHIRRLVTTQHAQERKWWEEREALVRRQAARGERKRELERVLQSVGAGAAAATTTTTTATDSKSENDQQTEENAVELAYHDAKVYKAATDLSRTTATELRRLGVPFFAIDESLVIVSTDTNNTNTTEEEKEGKKISKQELAVLKRRMLELLQDLCRD